CEKSGGVVNGVEQTPLQLPSSYNSVKCIMGTTNSSNRDDRNSNISKGSDIVTKQHSSGAEATKTAAGSMLHSVYPMQHVSVLSIPPASWIRTSLGPGIEDGKAEEKSNHRSRRRQLEGGSGNDDNVFSSAQWKNFYGFTYLDLSDTVSRLAFNKDSSDGKNKSLDENGNAVNQNYRMESINSSDRKGKTRRMK
ncbi:hypothetical protein L9F63_005394, partial [Diploptera punctata]